MVKDQLATFFAEGTVTSMLISENTWAEYVHMLMMNMR